ncbi:hypothetical protein Pcinc_014541 [Petrolisthes cinctipes]|uniref:Uncharacterized protein n=1 Tax=Petrolisthes cinctipes TaxID=88211 RepID=A0AAE1KQL6_PETCI|nr:hypothetical protein Pcinc_014538 [Petrolisthes cinctipes]KAK3880992.1 hypothetical protein Pcinc_014541 [Petrolisthes cinctipes]
MLRASPEEPALRRTQCLYVRTQQRYVPPACHDHSGHLQQHVTPSCDIHAITTHATNDTNATSSIKKMCHHVPTQPLDAHTTNEATPPSPASHLLPSHHAPTPASLRHTHATNVPTTPNLHAPSQRKATYYSLRHMHAINPMTTLDPRRHHAPFQCSPTPLNDAHAPPNMPRYTTRMPLATPHFTNDHITPYLHATRPPLPHYATRMPLALHRSTAHYTTSRLLTTCLNPPRYATQTLLATRHDTVHHTSSRLPITSIHLLRQATQIPLATPGFPGHVPNMPSTPLRPTHHHIGLPLHNTPLWTFRHSARTTPMPPLLPQQFPATTRMPPHPPMGGGPGIG